MKKPSQIFDTPQATGFDRVTHNTREGIEEMIEQKSLSARDCLPDEEVINASQAVEIFHQELQKARESERERIIYITKNIKDAFMSPLTERRWLQCIQFTDQPKPEDQSELDQGPDAFERQGL